MSRNTLLITLLLLLTACKPEEKQSDKPVISVSILPQQYFIERIAGEMVEVNVLIPPGASPATYAPTVSQLSKLDQSPLYLRIGYVGFELSWMNKIRNANPGLKIIDLSEGIDPIQGEEEKHDHLHGHAHGGIDPHIWMSALNAKIIAQNTYNAFIQHFPEEEEKLTFRYSHFLRELDSIHHSIKEILSDQEERSFMIYHPALSYFARDYNLNQYPLEIGGKTPSPAHMKWMIDLGREKGISTIFLQKQFDLRNAEVLAKEIGAKLVRINPLDPEWQDQMYYIANQLNTAL